MATTGFDLDGYLRRIGYSGKVAPRLETLEGIHLAHATHIPFENLDVLAGRPIRLDLESLQTKLVRDRRGGYCFEQNTLFAAALEAVGFQVAKLAARVRFGAQGVRPRTHMLLSVEINGAPWLADVGFGGWGLLHPLPLVAGPAVRQFAWQYRLLEEGGGVFVLEGLRPDGWLALYAFTTEPQYSVDFEMANYYMSANPESPFRIHLLAQRPEPEVRYILLDREFTIARQGGGETRTVETDEALLDLLREMFALDMPRGTRLGLPPASPSSV